MLFHFLSSLMKNFFVKTAFSSYHWKLNLPVFLKCILTFVQFQPHVSYKHHVSDKKVCCRSIYDKYSLKASKPFYRNLFQSLMAHRNIPILPQPTHTNQKLNIKIAGDKLTQDNLTA